MQFSQPSLFRKFFSLSILKKWRKGNVFGSSQEIWFLMSHVWCIFTPKIRVLPQKKGPTGLCLCLKSPKTANFISLLAPHNQRWSTRYLKHGQLIVNFNSDHFPFLVTFLACLWAQIMNPAPFYTTPNVTHLCDHWASKERFSKFVTHISKFNKFVTYISYVGGWGGSIFF